MIFGQDTSFWNKRMIQIAAPTSTPDWIKIKPETNIRAKLFFTDLKTSLGLSPQDEMRNYKTETDKTGITHYRYNQFYNGYKVEGAEYLVHEKEGRTISANGKLIKGLSIKPVISLSKQEALEFAKRFYPSKSYAWEILQLEKEIKEIFHDPKATYFPKGELLWVSKDKNPDKNDNNYALSYSFDIYTSELDGKEIYVNATDGSIIKWIPLTPDCNVTSVTTNFYGTQSFSTKRITGAPATYNLWNDCQEAFIHTMKWKKDSTPTSGGFFILGTDYITDTRNNWSFASSAATSHWGTERAYNYFLGVHGRKGWNNNDAGVNIYQDALINGSDANASMSNGYMKIGNSGTTSTIDDWNTLDLIAHEYTHAVTTSSANLIYEYESGALNESFSDIFGATCHAWLFGLSENTWKIGFDRKNPSNPSISLYIRNMAKPGDRSQPDTYLSVDSFWVPLDTTSDYGGVHTNSGVQNFMYYLLVNGGSGTNDNGLRYSVSGIGINAASDIAYQALTNYLTSASQYPDARNAWVHAAVDLYGECSYQAVMTGKAWDAVGLPPPINYTVIPYCGIYGYTNIFMVSNGITSLSPNCAMTIFPNSQVEFGARKIIFNPGFTAKSGSKFRAYVSDCSYSFY